MTTCPNCGRKITDDEQICPQCHFDLQKYRDTFFTDRHQKAHYENKKTAEKIVNRKLYREEFYPAKQNLTVKKMLDWLHLNSMLVFLLGIVLLVIMSFSRGIGWICFFALLIWLYIVAIHQEKMERYTVDQRLTAKINQVCSNLFNSVEESSQKVRAQNQGHQHTGEGLAKKHFTYVQLLVLLMAVINLIVVFTGSGASFSDVTYSGKMSITRVVFRLAGHLFAASATQLSGVVLCGIWLLIVLFPLLIIFNTLKTGHQHRISAFILSLIESIFLIYLLVRLSNLTLTSGGLFKNITNELLLYAVSVGTSTYFLILSSVMTTILTAYNLFKQKEA